jgi:diaminopimelate epimerase
MSFPEFCLDFTKMQGIGNDFVVVNNLSKKIDNQYYPELAKRMCARRFGIGADGLLILERGTLTAHLMRIINSDGSESEACGNGVRCFARYLVENDLVTEQQIKVETKAGLLTLDVLDDGQVQVNMGQPKFKRGEIGIAGAPESLFFEQEIEVDGCHFTATAVSMGNPHIVIFVENVEAINLECWGKSLENHPHFINGTNVHFVQILDRNNIIQRTWERGVGVTLACGTGACACVVSACQTQRTDRRVAVKLPGGVLNIDYREDDQVMMTGPAQVVYNGSWWSTSAVAYA